MIADLALYCAVAAWDALFFAAVCSVPLALLLLGSAVELVLLPFEYAIEQWRKW